MACPGCAHVTGYAWARIEGRKGAMMVHHTHLLNKCGRRHVPVYDVEFPPTSHRPPCSNLAGAACELRRLQALLLLGLPPRQRGRAKGGTARRVSGQCTIHAPCYFKGKGEAATQAAAMSPVPPRAVPSSATPRAALRRQQLGRAHLDDVQRPRHRVCQVTQLAGGVEPALVEVLHGPRPGQHMLLAEAVPVLAGRRRRTARACPATGRSWGAGCRALACRVHGSAAWGVKRGPASEAACGSVAGEARVHCCRHRCEPGHARRELRPSYGGRYARHRPSGPSPKRRVAPNELCGPTWPQFCRSAGSWLPGPGEGVAGQGRGGEGVAGRESNRQPSTGGVQSKKVAWRKEGTAVRRTPHLATPPLDRVGSAAGRCRSRPASLPWRPTCPLLLPSTSPLQSKTCVLLLRPQ